MILQHDIEDLSRHLNVMFKAARNWHCITIYWSGSMRLPYLVDVSDVAFMLSVV